MIGSDVFNQLLNTYGLLGVFIVSFLGNSIPYSTIPYFFVIIVYASRINDLTIQILIALAGGLGAALGKLVVYYIGRTARIVIGPEARRNMELFVKIAEKGIFLAVFIFAALPLPDDILYVPLGVSGYSVVKFFIALLIGKIIITGLAVFLGQAMRFLIEESAGMPTYVSIPIMIVVTILLTYIVAKIDWVKITQVLQKDGMVAASIILVKETLKALMSLPRIVYEKIRSWIERPVAEAQPVDPPS